jgi:predicted AAA+ superfamily ATPase
MSDTEFEIKIMRILNEQNPWWIEKKVPENLLKSFHRRDFYIYQQKLSDNNICAIIGPRQVGKTTVLFQLINDLIDSKKVKPNRILYNSFDYPYLSTITETPINDIIEVYSTHILKESIQKLNSPIYLFFDEICKLDNWSKVMKGWVDLKYPIKFVISDSSSTDITKGSSESLIGRINLNIMLSLKFCDYLSYYENDDNLIKVSLDLREKFLKAQQKKDPAIFFNRAKRLLVSLIPQEKQIKLLLNQYIIKNGYPEFLDNRDLIYCRQKLKDNLSLTIYKDLMKIFEIRDPKALEELISLVASESSQRMEYTNLSNTLGMKRDTVMKYLNYLEDVFLINRSEFYSKSRASRIKKSRKIYFKNVGLRNALIGTLSDSILNNPDELGKAVETIVKDHSTRLKFCLEPGIDPELYYWKSPLKEEVDIIFEIDRKPIPVEVKYTDNISNSDLKGIIKFMELKKSAFGIVVTKNSLDMKKNIIFIPLWLYLIMC